MIIAWGLFMPSILGIILAFKKKIDKDEHFKECSYDTISVAVFYIVALCSAQYIWG